MTARDDAIAAILEASNTAWAKSGHTLTFGEILDTAERAGAIIYADRLNPVGWMHVNVAQDWVHFAQKPHDTDCPDCTRIFERLAP